MASLILPPGVGEVHLHLRLTPLPDGSTAVDIDIDGAAARETVPLIEAARSLVDLGLDAEDSRAELHRIAQQIRYAVQKGRIRATGRSIDRGDFERWKSER